MKQITDTQSIISFNDIEYTRQQVNTRSFDAVGAILSTSVSSSHGLDRGVQLSAFFVVEKSVPRRLASVRCMVYKGVLMGRA